MEQQTILWMIMIGMTCFVVCDALTGNDSRRLLRYVHQRRVSEPFQIVNITQHLERNNRLLKLIRKRRINDNIRRGVRGTSELEDINHLRIRGRRASRPTTEQSRHQPVFDANKHIKRQRGDNRTICERVICHIGTYAKHCVKNFTADVCTPCPPGTNMFDVTKSEQSELECQPIHHCHHWPGTVPTSEMHACAGDYRMQCRCDTESGICGLDPCNCQKRKCRHDEILLQNCTCQQTIATVKVQVTKTEVPDSTPVPSLQPINTTESPPQVTTESTAESTTSTAARVKSTTATATVNGNSGDKVSWKTVGTTIGILCLIGLVVVLVLVFVIYHYRQKILDVFNRFQYSPVPLEN
ncbi:uncharacterized protein LOC110446172 [Mizuhopecten yessoensis]|uniref:Uncharacterized protein n=1 Tax=Mizuhopecten yessoensis TaxID=6573 RepID=A0A210QXY6_MIZYE|nr:uncharacterized protein LOC110446172 [Mizuhopecten yessoensis]OWF53618.1 hypothetical protein KP79_PYT21741 [Mizuhopecten yessoensis]